MGVGKPGVGGKEWHYGFGVCLFGRETEGNRRNILLQDVVINHQFAFSSPASSLRVLVEGEGVLSTGAREAGIMCHTQVNVSLSVVKSSRRHHQIHVLRGRAGPLLPGLHPSPSPIEGRKKPASQYLGCPCCLANHIALSLPHPLADVLQPSSRDWELLTPLPNFAFLIRPGIGPRGLGSKANCATGLDA